MEPPSLNPARVTMPTPTPKKTFRFTFHGTGSDLFGIFIMNLFKTICTLGIYFFWGKVRTRQFIWSQTEFARDRFGYHGTGRELLLGWLKAVLLFGGIVAIQIALELSEHPFLEVLALWIGLAFLIPVAQLGAFRYRLSRSSWRGVRFLFNGELQPFLLLSIRGLVLTALTLGVFYPFYECESRAYLISHSRFGSSAFEFNGKPKDLYWMYIKHGLATTVGVTVLAFLTFAGRDLTSAQDDAGAIIGFAMFIPFVLLFGVVLLSVAVRRRRFYWSHTSFAGARFNTTVTMGNLLSLYLTNLLLLFFSLGLAFPWITVRSRQYDCEHLTLTGALDFDSLQQDVQTATAVGEELGGFLDVDAIPS